MKSPLLTLAAVLLLLVLFQTATSRPKHRKLSRNPQKTRKRIITTPKPLLQKTSTSSTESTTSPKPYTTTTTTTPETTTPLCLGENGEQLQVGQEATYGGGCRGYICMPGGVQRYVVDCMIPMCVDYTKGNDSCCGTCPNGPNCLIEETGEVISETVERDGLRCWCPDPYEYISNFRFDIGPTAMCIPLTTTPPPTTTPPCVGDDGEVLVPGQHIMYSDGGSCRYCECDQSEGFMCLYGDCLPPMCVDYLLWDGGCCYECPNDQNCRIEQTGEIITTQVKRDDMLCWCPQQVFIFPGYPSPEYYTAICVPSNTSTTPETTTTPWTPEDTSTIPSESWTSTDATDTSSLEPQTHTDTSTPEV